ESRLQVLQQHFRTLVRVAAGAHEALHEDAVESAHDEPGLEAGDDGRAEDALLAAAVEDVGEEIAVHALELVHVPDEIVRMLLLAQDQAQEELHGVKVLGHEAVVSVDQQLDLVELRETCQLVEHVDDVGLERPLHGAPEELLLVLEVPEDERLRDLSLLRNLRERRARVPVRREETGRRLEDFLPGFHRPRYPAPAVRICQFYSTSDPA